ncbi:glycoside hydrolase family 61 protein [Chaetomium fimeti]|uniref:lytic cellulose monooxygenase (C4-dehydrogenating) n=1 Tax=Chaetomium fimeti TaxID=1854472 RepID=A0AAE0HGS4_9PEZI|nr:glycoside hydrolase family 61 protein [Chaetomium fimeti]
MPPPLLTTLLAFLTLTPTATLAHSHLAHILINGQLYHGFDPRPNQPNDPSRVGWWTAATDDGFVTPANYTHPDIICHKSGASPAAHAPVRAGDRVHVQWNGWPMGHVGPVLSYLAGCAGLEGDEAGCTGVDKAALRWTKVDDSQPVLEFVEGAGINGGVPGQRWASDVLIAANNSWQVAIPDGLAPGPYVLRNEVIALHYAAEEDGAQNYPLCVNLWVEGGDGGMELDGFEATEFYREDDPGVWLNVTAGLSSYVVPGPTVAVGATPVPYAEQTISLFEAEGTPVVVLRGTETVPFSGGAAPTAEPRARGRYDRN